MQPTNRCFQSLCLALLLYAVSLTATTDSAAGLEIPEFFVPVRPLGMGDAFVAIANDEDAIWHNPAGVSRIRKARSRAALNLIKFPNLTVGTNTEARSFYTDFNSQTEALADYIANNTTEAGQPFWFNISAFPMMMIDAGNTPTAIGLFANNSGKIVIEKDSAETADVEIISDVGGLVTFSVPNRTNRFSVGMTLRGIKRYAYQDFVPTNELADKAKMQSNFTNFSNQVVGLGVDVGMIATFADFWYPTIGLSILNLPTGCKENYLNPFNKKRQTICGNRYQGTFNYEDALSTVDPTDVRVGFSITPRLSRKLALRLALDVHHISFELGADKYAGLPDIELSKMIHMGAELFVGNPLVPSDFSLRSGYSQGFFSFGASTKIGVLSIDFATYGRDVSSTTKAIEDRRIVTTFSMDL